MHYPFYSPSEGNLEGKILISVSEKSPQDPEPEWNPQPIVSNANIGQLATDLIISSLDLHRIGIFSPRDLVPVVGAREDTGPGVTTPLERSLPFYSCYLSSAHCPSLRQAGCKHRCNSAKVPSAQGNPRPRKPIIIIV